MTRNSLHSNKPSSAASHRGAAHGPKQTATAHPPSHEPFGQRALREMLSRVAAGEMAVDAALQSLAMLPFEDLGFANLDHHRGMRKNFPEVVFCAGKTTGQVATIIKRLAAVNPRVLGTRATREQYLAARRGVPGLKYHELARAIWLDREAKAPKAAGVAIVAAGTSDLHVAEEAAITLELMGQAPQRVYDVGVAGLHRLIQHLPALMLLNILIFCYCYSPSISRRHHVSVSNHIGQ